VIIRVLSVSCPGASQAFLATLAYRKINKLRVINSPEWFKSTPPATKNCSEPTPSEYPATIRIDKGEGESPVCHIGGRGLESSWQAVDMPTIPLAVV
jgi:hypothetical protein